MVRPSIPVLAGSLLAMTLVGCGSTSAGSTSTTPPQSSFTLSPTAPKAGQAVQFTDTSTGTPTSWAWNFGDGGTATTQNPTHTFTVAGPYTVTLTATNAGGSNTKTQSLTVAPNASTLKYGVVDTGQTLCYGAMGTINAPAAGQAFYGQDAQCNGFQASYSLGGDGLTVKDNNTGLTWQRSPDTSLDGSITYADKLTFAQAQNYPATLNAKNFGGYGDWRLPTIKELYSLMDFRGEGAMMGPGKPFIDTNYFKFVFGFTDSGERTIDSQWLTSSTYVANPTNQMFGVNFADGRIKGYPTTNPAKVFCVICVRGNPDYGKNNFSDNGDGTVTDKAASLMWTKNDSGAGMNWEQALAWVQTQNTAKYLGHSDWRLPNAKELQSIVDYARSPDTTRSAAIDPVFSCTQITNENYQPDYPWYWSGTTLGGPNGMDDGGVYVAFGRAMGYGVPGNIYLTGWQDVHGAGCQRSDPKGGDLSHFIKQDNGYYNPQAPQGDAIRINNYVRLVRDAN